MTTETKRLYRSRSDRMIAGVCAGMGKYLGIDATVIRLLFALLAIFTGVVPGLILYIVMMFIVPDEPLSSPPAPPEPPAPEA
jgi:phage shock protein PspC (stress-responsive transcriptional regulator)